MYPKHFPIQPEDRTSCEHARRRTKIWVDEVLVLGTNDSHFTRNEILELCEALRGVTQRKMLIKYLRFAQLQGNNFNPDEGGVDELSADLLALNAWTDAPYYFYKRASQGFLAFSD
ncbi:unnamed protein product [Durusdinium trenchii]|uniref:Uncharacterized protein n=1 Tax=Durusdinium trenchii TaxID=1381693 RepID=A0ABP0KCU9_9DINO